MVTANSRNSRPRIPAMNRSGMNTAASDSVIETMVKPISWDPFSAACERLLAHLDVPHDVFQHHDGIVNHKSDRENQAHQRDVVQAEIQQIHHGERAQNGETEAPWQESGRGKLSQEHEDDQDDQASVAIMVNWMSWKVSRMFLRPVAANDQVHAGWNQSPEVGSSRRMSSTIWMVLLPGCASHGQHDDGRAILAELIAVHHAPSG